MIVCDVCRAPDPDGAYWSNEVLLGTDDVLCRRCVRIWYEEGVCSREGIRARIESLTGEDVPP